MAMLYGTVPASCAASTASTYRLRTPVAASKRAGIEVPSVIIGRIARGAHIVQIAPVLPQDGRARASVSNGETRIQSVAKGAELPSGFSFALFAHHRIPAGLRKAPLPAADGESVVDHVIERVVVVRPVICGRILDGEARRAVGQQKRVRRLSGLPGRHIIREGITAGADSVKVVRLGRPIA